MNYQMCPLSPGSCLTTPPWLGLLDHYLPGWHKRALGYLVLVFRADFGGALFSLNPQEKNNNSTSTVLSLSCFAYSTPCRTHHSRVAELPSSL